MKKFFSVLGGTVICIVVIVAFAAGGFFLLYTPSLTVDVSETTGEVTNGASGYLYGIAEDGVPSYNMTESVDISTIAQKVHGGLQHPTGDIENVSNQIENTTYNVVYIQDSYSTWYYEQDNIEKLRSEGEYDCESFVKNDYLPKVKETVEYMSQTSYSDKVVYCIYNECDNGVWFGETKKSSDSTYGVYGDYNDEGEQNFFAAWKETYELVKSIDPDALVGGPGFCDYDDDEIKNFFAYCAENDCVPDIMIYHELGSDSIYHWQEHVNDFKALESDLSIKEIPIIVTEYGEMQDNGKPGKMLQFVTQIETSKVYADNAFWRLSNNLCDVCADDNMPNSNWWLYRWYTDMEGQTLSSKYQDLFRSNVGKAIKGEASFSSKGFMGIACVNDSEDKLEIICGGRDGSAAVKLKNIGDTSFYRQNVKIKIEEVLYKGISGVVTSPVTVKEYTEQLNSDKLTIDVNDLDEANVYRITIEKTTDEITAEDGDVYSERYEFESGELTGGAYVYDSAYATTGDTEGMVGGMENDGDGVTLEFDVPSDGTYDLNFIYGNSNDGEYDDDGKQNPDDRTYSTASLTVDGEQIDMTVPNTIKSEYTDCYTYTAKLEKGEHKVTVKHKTGTIVLDSLLVTSENAGNEISVLADADRTSDDKTAFLAVVGSDGYYEISASDVSDGAVLYINDNKTTYYGNSKFYLMRGLNFIEFESQSVGIPTLEKYDGEAQGKAIDAGSFKLSGSAQLKTNSAVDVSYIDGISCNSGSAKCEYTADEAGTYAITFTYANNDEGGKHDYNVDLIERYVTLSVNGKKQDVYCRNTYSWDTYKTVTVYVTLKKGKNTVSLSNSGNNKFDNADTYAAYISQLEFNKISL